ncbi:MAG: DHH family phosphoesterase [Planctomycetota bacterium]|jgi:phosphoesterase RecJ-like protein
MSDYVTNATLDELATTLRDASSVVVTTHSKPDGDAMGSAAALAFALSDLGKRAECWFVGPVLESLAFVAEGLTVRVIDATQPDHPIPPSDGSPEPDAVVVVDTGAWPQLGPLRGWLEPRRDKTIGLDHHLRGDDVAHKRIVDTSAAAACEIVADLIDALGVGFTHAIAQALYLGIASDTGWFRFSSTSDRTLELAARLKRVGVDHAALHARTEQRERVEKLALMRRALESITYHADGRAAVMRLTGEDFAQAGAGPEDVERIIDLPQVVSRIETVVLMTPAPGPGGDLSGAAGTKLSLRSKPVEDFVNVSDLAQPFGGGGHAHAAGARTPDDMATAYEKLVAALEEVYARR